MSSRITVFSSYLEKNEIIKNYNAFCERFFSCVNHWPGCDVFNEPSPRRGDFKKIESSRLTLTSIFGEEVYDMINIARECSNQAAVFADLLYFHCLLEYFKAKDFEIFSYVDYDLNYASESAKAYFNKNIEGVKAVVNELTPSERETMMSNFRKVIIINNSACLPFDHFGINESNFPLDDLDKFTRTIYRGIIAWHKNVLVGRVAAMKGGAEGLADALLSGGSLIENMGVLRDERILTCVLNSDFNFEGGHILYTSIVIHHILLCSGEFKKLESLTDQSKNKLKDFLSEIILDKYREYLHESAELYKKHIECM